MTVSDSPPWLPGSGTVNANGTASNWWIEYGTTLAYGATTAPQPIATLNDDTDVNGALAGLAAGTLYHARIVVSSTAGTDPGDDVVFTTLGTPAPVPPVTGGGATGGTTPTGGTKPTTPAKPKAKAKKQCIVPKVTGKKLNKARTSVYAKGCKVQVKYLKSKKAKNTVLAQSRKAGKKLGYRAVVKLTVARRPLRRSRQLSTKGPGRLGAAGPFACPALESTAGPVAQLVEQGTFNPKVAGSRPARPILPRWTGLSKSSFCPSATSIARSRSTATRWASSSITTPRTSTCTSCSSRRPARGARS